VLLARGLWPAQDPQQSLEAVGRHGCLRPDDRVACVRRRGGEGHHDRRDLSQIAPHGREPAGQKRWPDDKRGRLIGRTKGELNTKVHAGTDAKVRPLRSFMPAGSVEITPVLRPCWAACLPQNSGLPIGVNAPSRRHPSESAGVSYWLPETLREKGIRPCIPRREPRGKANRHDRHRHKRRNRLKIMFGRLKY
jgi:hypothetical protein